MKGNDTAQGGRRIWSGSSKKPIWFLALLIFSAVVLIFQLFYAGTVPKSDGPAAGTSGSKAASQIKLDEQLPAWTEHALIAHALGGIDGESYTNSYDAFAANYAAGARVFEADLILTSDDQLVARHDWSRESSELMQPGLPDAMKEGPVPYDAFMNTAIMGKYEPMDVDDMIRILRDYPDIYLVTDTKETDPKLVSEQFRTIVEKANETDPSLLERIIPELYSEEMIKQVKGIYPFPNYLFSLYLSTYDDAEIEDIVTRNDIRTVAMPEERATPELIGGLQQLGTYAYVHTINDTAKMSELYQMGVRGFYTDFVSPEQMVSVVADKKPGKA